NLEKEMCYRLAGTISSLIKTVADNASTIDSSVSQPQSGSNVLVRTVLTSLGQELRHRSVLPFTDNEFVGVVDPLAIGDVMNDSANNSLFDIYKHTKEGLDRFLDIPGSDGEDAVVP